MNKTLKRAIKRSRTNSEFYCSKSQEPPPVEKDKLKAEVEPGLSDSLKESLNK